MLLNVIIFHDPLIRPTNLITGKARGICYRENKQRVRCVVGAQMAFLGSDGHISFFIDCKILLPNWIGSKPGVHTCFQHIVESPIFAVLKNLV